MGPGAGRGLTPGMRADTLNTNEVNICSDLSVWGKYLRVNSKLCKRAIGCLAARGCSPEHEPDPQ